MRLLASLLFVLVFVPIAWFRRVTGVSRFGRRFHRSASSWDLGAARAVRDADPGT